MNLFSLILKNIRHYRRSWLLTLAGSVIGTAVLTGALITGDSVRYSLAHMVDWRLGKTSLALAPSDRYFRAELAGELSGKSDISVVPAYLTKGNLTNPKENLYLNQVNVVGIDQNFSMIWDEMPETPDIFQIREDEAVISANVAERLTLRPGDAIILKVPDEGFAPSNAPFVSDQPDMKIRRFTISAIASDQHGGRFSLNNNQNAPFNIFLNLKSLSNLTGIPGFANTLLVADQNQKSTSESMGGLLKSVWKPDDAGLLGTLPEPGIRQWSSRRIFIDEPVASLIREKIPGATGALSYLVNSLKHGKVETPYSFVTAAAPGFMPMDAKPGFIVINEWLADDLSANKGDTLVLSFWVMGAGKSLKEKMAGFIVQEITPTENSASMKSLMPDFPGMSSSGSCRDWETGAPVDLKKIRDKDEAYWKKYKGSPKAWISLEDGQRLWGNPFGSYTHFRVDSGNSPDSSGLAMNGLEPASIGLIFRAVREEGLQGAANSTDFGELFLSLGGLIIIAGLMLSGMMFSLFLLRRRGEIALLHALGFRQSDIRKLFFTETITVILPGSIAGSALAAAYSAFILGALNTLWKGAVQTGSLLLFISPVTLITGCIISIILNIIIFGLILYKFRNQTNPSFRIKKEKKGNRYVLMLKKLNAVIVVFMLLAAIGIPVHELLSQRFFPSVNFMISGILLMMTGLFSFSLLLNWKGQRALTSLSSTGILIIKNLYYQRKRAMITTTLIALGTFSILLTGLNRKTAAIQAKDRDSGTGGFAYWMESTALLMNDLNLPENRKKSGIDEALVNQGTRFYPLPEVAGDDASCLNLNQVSLPGLLGIPVNHFNLPQRFSFSTLAIGIDPEHPWKALNDVNNAGVINGFADQTVITWGFQRKTGDTLFFRDEQGQKLAVRIAGGLKNSIFQGYLLVSDSLLRSYFPSAAKPRITLIDAPDMGSDLLARTLERQLTDQGAVVIKTSEKLSSFGIVENTYLDVFMMLGGLGVILGTAGLAVVMLRSLEDRRDELMILRSLGFSDRLIQRLIHSEFLILFAVGNITGILGALAGTLPSWVHSTSSGLIFPLFLTLAILANGVLWILAIVKRISSQ